MKEQFDIKGMSCAACQAHVQKAVEKLDGATSVNVNLLTNSMDVDFDENKINVNDIINAVKASGYGASLKQEKQEENTKKKIDKALILLIIAVIDLIILMYFSMGNMMWNWPVPSIFDHHASPIGFSLIQLGLSLPIIIIYHTYFVSGLKKLFKGHPNMDTLIAVGASFSLIYSIYCIVMIILGNHEYHMYLYFESACMILTFVSIGKYLESLSKKKTTVAIEKLMKLSPKQACVVRNGEEVIIDSKDVLVHDIVIVRKGDLIPVDGKIIEGNCSIDQSSITGESIPVEKHIGDEVYSSTIITAGYVKIDAEKVGKDTSIETIIALVEEASNSKAPISKLADKISGVFVPIILIVALITFIGNLLYLNIANPTWFTGNNFETALNYAITVVVIACPCALGLATPVAIMVGTGKGAENGLLIRNAEILEKAHLIKTVVLDKTGTITNGLPHVVDFISYSDDDLASILYAFEVKSEHPLALAIVEYTKTKALNDYEITNYETIDGIGIRGYIENDLYEIGNLKFLDNDNTKVTDTVNSLAKEGKTPLIILKNKEVIGIISCKDEVKTTSKDAIRKLQNEGIEVVMLTGDNKETAESIAKEVGINKIYASVLPTDKEEIIKSLKKDNKNLVAMVGDGVNDALALTSADLAIGIGAGSDIAIESSDIILLRNDLLDILNVIKLSDRVVKTIKLGLFWAFFYNAICVFLSLGILFYLTKGKFMMEPMYGSIAMSISSVSVVLNALTINLFKVEHSNKIEENKGEEEMFGREKIVIDVDGMMCMNCVKHVEEACEKVEGVISAKASLEDKNVTVKFKGEVSKEALVKAINDAGYKAK